ncbi:iron-sulfur cluster assembly scaffold protein [bacterium]|nr:iron-sulfur cluster assembly scaffold protein [bacterium]
MTDLEWLLTHSRHPYHQGSTERVSLSGEVASRTCADLVSLEVVLDGEVIREIWHRAQGCMVSQASASFLCERFEGAEVRKVQSQTHEEYLAELGTLTPLRQQCALQAFRCLQKILGEPVTSQYVPG